MRVVIIPLFLAMGLGTIGCEPTTGSSDLKFEYTYEYEEYYVEPTKPATVNILLTDDPASFIESFYVTISECYLLNEYDEWIRVYPGQGLRGRIKLNMTSYNLRTHLLAGALIDPGKYYAICLKITSILANSCDGDVSIKLSDGKTFPIYVTSYFCDPIKLYECEQANIICDLNLRHSLFYAGTNTYIFKPCLAAKRTWSKVRLGNFRARVISVDTDNYVVTCRLKTGATIQVSIPSYALFYGRGSVLWRTSAYRLLYEDVIINISGEITPTMVVAHCIELEEDYETTFEFKGFIIDKTPGYIKVLLTQNVSALNRCADEAIWVDIYDCLVATPSGSLVSTSYLCPGTMVRLECLPGEYPRAVMVDMTGLQISGTIYEISGSSITLKKLSVSGFNVDSISKFSFMINDETRITLSGMVSVSKSALRVGDNISVYACWARDGYIADEIRIVAKITSCNLTSLTLVTLNQDGSVTVIINDSNGTRMIRVEALAEIVLIVGDTSHTLPSTKLPDVIKNQTQGTVDIEVGEQNENSTDPSSGRVIIRGDNGGDNGQNTQPPANSENDDDDDDEEDDDN